MKEHDDQLHNSGGMLDNGYVIGGFECTFDRRAVYVYRCHWCITGFFVHIKQWKHLEIHHPDVFRVMRRKTLTNYITQI